MKVAASRLIHLSEYESLSYDALSPSAISELENTTGNLGIPVFKFFRKTLRAQNYVGFIRAQGCTIQIIPKIFDNKVADVGFLTALLAYTNRLKMTPTSFLDQSRVAGAWFEIWIQHFARELNRLLCCNPRWEYIERREDVQFLRGKLLIHKLTTGESTLATRYPCQFEEFSSDYLLYQILKCCNGLLLYETSVSSTMALLRENNALLSGVDDRMVQPDDIDRVRLNRLNRQYEPLLQMCRLLLTHCTLDFRAGRISQLTFVFDMNRLFEEFVAEFIGRHRRHLTIGGQAIVAVDKQHFIGRLFGEFRMLVDLVIEDNSGRQILLDTKYKTLAEGKRHLGLSQSDFYQMYAYTKAGKKAYDDVILLFPLPSSQADYTENTYVSNGVRLHVRQLDLRRMFDEKKATFNEKQAVEEFSRALAV